MLKNYLLIAFRNLYRQRMYALLNISGLAIGMASAILLLMYIYDELSYDQHFKYSSSVFRIVTKQAMLDKEIRFSSTPGVLKTVLPKEFPEIAYSARLYTVQEGFMQYRENKLNAGRGFFAEKDFFELFDYPFLYGQAENALAESNTIVLTKNLAEKIFGIGQDARGETIRMEIYGKEYSFRVTAVLDKDNRNSHLEFQYLVSFETLVLASGKDKALKASLTQWNIRNLATYVRLREDANQILFTDKVEKELFDRYVRKEEDEKGAFIAQPITKIRFDSYDFIGDQQGGYNFEYVLAFGLIVFFIILIASINYMNLATARSIGRAKEVGIRKVLGAYRGQLIFQFLSEAILLVFIAGLLSLSLVELFLPAFNHIADKHLFIDYINNPLLIILYFILVILVGILCGSYPAFFLSNFKPALVLKGHFPNQKGSLLFRRVLVIVQFSISTIMIAGTFVIYQQMHYIQSKDLGLRLSNLLMVNLYGNTGEKIEILKTKLSANPAILNVSSTTTPPKNFNYQGMTCHTEKGEKMDIMLRMFYIDSSYVNLFGIKLSEGRNFNLALSADNAGVIVNREYVKKMGIQGSPIGLKMFQSGYFKDPDSIEFAPSFKIIGVVEDFHMDPLYRQIEPSALFISNKSNPATQLLVKIHSVTQPDSVLKFIKSIYEKVDQKYPFEYSYLEQDFAKQYQKDQNRGQLFLFFSVLAIIIGSLGLLGLAAFTVEQRNKEIGIRKVLGASISEISLLVSKQFIYLISIANIIALPFTWYMMVYWLEGFAYHIDLASYWYIFLWVFFLTVLIVLVTISTQIYRATTTNPVNVLKNE